MTEALFVAGVLLSIFGVGVALWSIVDTRKRYNARKQQ